MHKYMVKATKRLTPTTVLLTLEPKRAKDRLQFNAGQYAAIGFRRRLRPSPMRCFSIVSSPQQARDTLQFAMRVYGDFTHAIAELNAGTEMIIQGPFGNFIVDEQFDRNLVLLAGGIGITPFMSIIRDAAEKQSQKPITLLYSCSSQDEIPFYEELRELERQNPRFKPVFFITSGPTDKLSGARVLGGRIGAAHLERLTSGKYNACTFFLCGPKGFLNGLRDLLSNAGTDADRIVTEEFTPASKSGTIAGTQSGWSVTRWTYGLTSAALLTAVGFIMSLDLVRTVPRLASNVTKTSTSSQSAATNTTSGDSSTSATDTTNPTSTTTAPAATTTPTPTTTTTTPAKTVTPPKTTYQPPVTSVS